MTKKIKVNIAVFVSISLLFFSFMDVNTSARSNRTGVFNPEKDLLLVQMDCKTDVDDLHTAAGLVTLLSDPEYSDVNFHAVTGTYGIQEGLYVPPNDLMQLAFITNWTDAHSNRRQALKKVTKIVKKALKGGGDIWIAEAGQSDFSAALVKSIHKEMPDVKTVQRIHIVQHSDWNEEVTSPADLEYVKLHTDYNKIPDGNTVDNGTPGFRSPLYTDWKEKVKEPRILSIWQLAVDLGNRYNGKDGRYNNEAVASGGLDFSDLSEVCWILGIQDIRDTEAFFERFGH